MRLKTFSLLCLAAFLVACSSGTPTAKPLQPVPTAQAATPTVRPETTATIAPTRPAPTAASVAPTASAQLGPDTYPAGVNPLTGLVVDNPASLNRRPIGVKVSEFPRRVRPQAGLSFADLVFEHYAEASVTRMTAIYLSNEVPKIGSIRSARLIDIVLSQSYKLMLVTSGSSQGVLDELAKTDFYNRVIAEATGYTKCPPLCREEGAELTTDKLFASTKDLWQITSDLGLNTAQNLHGLAFAPEAPAGGQTANTVRLVFHSEVNVAEWRYDAASKRYARWVDTATPNELAPHTDALNDQQLTAANVVVLHAHHQPTVIVEDFANGGHCGYEIQIWGSGPATLFRDGQAYELTWVRFAPGDVIGFVGPDNKIFPFKPGNTWFEVTNLGVPTKLENGVYTSQFKGLSQLNLNCPVGNAASTPAP